MLPAKPTTHPLPTAGSSSGERPQKALGRAGCSTARCEGPAVWLPWCMAPLWVFLPIIGCLLAGVVRRPAVAGGPPQDALIDASSTDLMTVGLVPIPPLADSEAP